MLTSSVRPLQRRQLGVEAGPIPSRLCHRFVPGSDGVRQLPILLIYPRGRRAPPLERIQVGAHVPPSHGDRIAVGFLLRCPSQTAQGVPS
jgi:hypothetical protein